MLRSDNIQVRSQLSATQRRMLQEKQQVMDYLRQIENDLIEKEQIKQRESILRKDYGKLQLAQKQDRQEIDQLNVQINQQKQKLDQLEQERLQLFKTIQNMDDNKVQLEVELNSYKSATKRLYTYFKIPFDSIQSIDQLIPMLEDRYRTEQISQARIHHIPLVKSTSDVNHEQETEDIRQLRQDLYSMNIQLKQLNDANQAWQQYQQNQITLLCDRFKLTNIDHLSFEDIIQQIENRFNIINNQLIDLQNIKKTDDGLQKHIDETQIVSTQLMRDDNHQSKYTQTENNEEYQQLQKDQSAEISIQSSTPNLNQYEEELRELRESLTTLTTQYTQLNEANRTWEQYHQNQLDSFKNKLQVKLPMETDYSFDDIAQHITTYIDQIQKERENLMQYLQTSETLTNDLRSELANNNTIMQETYANTINELNQKILMLKQQNDQLEAERKTLITGKDLYTIIQIINENYSIDSTSVESQPVNKQISASPVHEAKIHTITPIQSGLPIIDEQELQQLRDNVTLLTNQCAQLDEANRAWQQYQTAQLQDFRSKLHDYLTFDENASFDIIAQQIVEQISKEREDFNEKYEAIEKANDILRSESTNNLESIHQTYTNTLNELNQKLLAMKNRCEELDTEKQLLSIELEKRCVEIEREHANQTIEKVSSETLKQPLKEVPIHTSSTDVEEERKELEKLRDNIAHLTNQCAQLNEANRAWLQYQQTQFDTFRNTLYPYLPIDETFTLDQAAQQILHQTMKERQDFTQRYEALEKVHDDFRLESATNLDTIKQSYTDTIDELNKKLLNMKEQDEPTNKLESTTLLQKAFEKTPIKSDETIDQQETEEIRQLRENLVSLTSQLDETKRTSQQYKQTQLDILRNQLQHCLSIDSNISFDDIAQQIVDQVTKEREDFNEKYQALEKENDNLRSELTNNMESIRESYVNTVNELNQELLIMKKQCEQFDAENQILTNELEKRSVQINQEQVEPTIEKISLKILKQPFEEVPIHTNVMNVEEEGNEIEQLRESVSFLTNQCAQLDEANRAWQQYQAAQLENFRSKVQDYLSFDENASFDIIAQEIVEQISKEREDFNEKYEAIEKANDKLRSGTSIFIIDFFYLRFFNVASTGNFESIQESYMNTINELNEQLLVMKDRCEELAAEKQFLSIELEKRCVEIDREHSKQTIEKVPSNILRQPFKEVPIHTTGVNVEDERKELEQLRESVTLLTSQCAQLDEANRAWQQYHQTQLNSFRNILHHHLPIDERFTLDQAAEHILHQVTKERENFTQRYQALEKVNDDVRLESATNLETIKESYINTIDELNKELLTMKEQCEILMAEKQALSNELGKKSVEFNIEQKKKIIESEPIDLLQEIPLQTSSSNFEQENEELQQLRENFAILTSEYAQSNEANRAWQEFHQSQVDNFRSQIQDFIQIDNDLSFEHVAQKIIDQITQERESFNERYEILEKAHTDLQSETLDSNLLEQQTKMSELQEDLISLRTQLDETNHSRQQFEQTQFNLFKNVLPDSTKMSLEELIQEIILYINHLTKEIDLYKELENNTIEQELMVLQNQCTELDAANRAWQLFFDNQTNLLKDSLKDYIHFDNNENFDQISQLIIIKFQQQKQFNENISL
ncbi:unnamed protein product, partial [Rotaria sp. Silwood1]